VGLPNEKSQSDFTPFGVGALPEIRPDCHMFLEIFLGYNGQHKSVMHRYFQMNK